MFSSLINQLQRFAVECGVDSFLGLQPWYIYICGRSLDNPQDFLNALPLIALAVVEDLLRIAGLVAIAYVVFGAVKYVVSQGEPDKTAEAKGTIINALAGLIIASLAVAMVSFIGNRLG
jgi:hypothetical protein